MMTRGLDIFSGAGGSSAGARAAGVEVVAGVDMCSTATETFAANFPEALVMTSRLEDVCLDSLKRETGEIDILLASPECTNHTCAKGGAPRDEASRATAMLVVEYARVLRPRWFVLENVIQMRPWSRYGELNTVSAILVIYCKSMCWTQPISVWRNAVVGCFWWVTANGSRTGKFASDLDGASRQSPYLIPKVSGRLPGCSTPSGRRLLWNGRARVSGARRGRELSPCVLRERWRRRMAAFEPTSPHGHDSGPLCLWSDTTGMSRECGCFRYRNSSELWVSTRISSCRSVRVETESDCSETASARRS